MDGGWIEMKEKYARIVFEEEIPEDASEDEITKIIAEAIEDFMMNSHMNIDDIEIHERPYIQDECNNDTYKPGDKWELFEVDSFLGKVLKKINLCPIDDIKVARIIAKEFAKNWCEDEEPKKEKMGDEKELWIGESDFGILITKVGANYGK